MDIVEHCQVPRYLHNNFPLGNPLGSPYDHKTQRRTIEIALDIVTKSTGPTSEISALTWPEDDKSKRSWQSVYGRVDDSNRALLAKLGDQNRQNRRENMAMGLSR